MTRIDELKSQIADKKKRMEAINAAVETAKRIKNETERTEFDNLVKEVNSLQAELNDMEAVERIKIEAPAIITSEQKEKNKRYSITKAISEFSNKRLSGLEAELHDEATRNLQGATGLLVPNSVIYRTETMANSAGLYTQNVVGLDIVAPQSLADKMGVTKYDNLTGTYKFNYSKGVEADKVAEGVALSGKTYNKVTDEIKPNTYGHQIEVTKEALAVTSMVQGFIVDADTAIQAKLFQQLIADILANTGCTLSGHGSAATAVVMTSKIVNKLKAAVLSPIFRKPAYITGSEMFAELEETKGATEMRTIITENKVNGYNIYDAMGFMAIHDTNKYDILFGDWSRASIGTWGDALEILVNPYSKSATRTVELTFNRLADSSFNPFVFKAIRNAKLA